jgi:hypothetical protein
MMQCAAQIVGNVLLINAIRISTVAYLASEQGAVLPTHLLMERDMNRNTG